MKRNCLEDRCFKHINDYKMKKMYPISITFRMPPHLWISHGIGQWDINTKQEHVRSSSKILPLFKNSLCMALIYSSKSRLI